jgi:hypothetical protein
MAHVLAELKEEWRAFKRDEPGDRFANHHDRMKRGSMAFRIVTTLAGIFLLLAGIVLLFIPGPGTPLLVFGVGALSAHWRWFAEKLDKAEPRLRAWYQRMNQRLKRRRQHSY